VLVLGWVIVVHDALGQMVLFLVLEINLHTTYTTTLSWPLAAQGRNPSPRLSRNCCPRFLPRFGINVVLRRGV
ncbi:hypothetical protein EDB85DRAFT_1928729, partial [Lactarius pseudohatsudake]